MTTPKKGKTDHVVNLCDFSREGMAHFQIQKSVRLGAKITFLHGVFLKCGYVTVLETLSEHG